MSNTRLVLKDVDKFYGPIDNGVHAVRQMNMNVAAGEIVALLGSSGCGKTSILRMIAGFEQISHGSIKIAGKAINALPPVKRGVAMAFEGYSLYPPLTVRDNLAFALKSSTYSAAQVKEKVSEIAAMLEIEDILDRYPSSISGGQQQRASLGRALVRDADLHLLDEPMGQLEPQLRAILRGRIKYFIKERGLTAILVTHDQAEANALADRIAVMEEGTLQQLATPELIKERPANLFAGTFIGEPPMNIFPASPHIDGVQIKFQLDGGVTLGYDNSAFSADVLQAIKQHSRLVLGVRPYAVKRKDSGVPATVAASQWLGDQSHIAADFADGSIVLVEHDRAAVAPGDTIHLELEPAHLHFFNADNGVAIAHGQELAL